MTERTGPPITFDDFVGIALAASTDSPCRSKRGAVAFNGRENERRELVAVGFNTKPDGSCDGSALCKSSCRREAVHAEQALIVSTANLEGADVIHVKSIAGALVVSGGPSCLECAKLLRLAGVAAVWLYHLEGWRRYPILEFHALSLASARAGLEWIGDRGSRAPLYPDGAPCSKCFQVYEHAAHCQPSGGHDAG
jgi:hypothetical protein